MRRWAVPCLLGLALLASAVTGRAAVLVRPWFLPVLAVTGVLVVAVARPAGRMMTGRAAGWLLLPVAAVLTLMAGPVQTATSAQQPAGAVSARLGDGENPLVAGRGGAVTLLQVLVARDQVGAVALDGRRVSVVGVSDGKDAVWRLVMVCCAADARRVQVTVTGTALPPSGRWVEVDGTLAAHGPDVVLVARSVRVVPVPDRPEL